MIQVARQEGLNVEQNAAEILVEQVRVTRLLALTPPATLCAAPLALHCPALHCTALSDHVCPMYSHPLNYMPLLLFDFHPFSLSDIYYHIIPTRGIPPFSSPTRNFLTPCYFYCANFVDLTYHNDIKVGSDIRQVLHAMQMWRAKSQVMAYGELKNGMRRIEKDKVQ